MDEAFDADTRAWLVRTLDCLVAHGVDASRLTTISYGKERPAVLGSDEAAWSKNRRAASITIDG